MEYHDAASLKVIDEYRRSIDLSNNFEGHSDRINSCSFSPNGSMIVSCSEDKTIRLWDVETGRCLHTLKDHTDRINSCSFSPDSLMVVSCSNDETVRLWNVKTGNCLRVFRDHNDYVSKCSFSPDGSMVASYSYRKVKLYDVKFGVCLLTTNTSVKWKGCYSFSNSSSTIITCHIDKTIKLWDVNGIRSSQPVHKCLKVLKGHDDWVTLCSFSPDDLMIISHSEDDMTVRLWDVKTGGCLKVFQMEPEFVNLCSFLLGGSRIIISYNDVVELWDVRANRYLVLKGHTDKVNSYCLSPNELILATNSCRETILWDIKSGECLKSFKNCNMPMIFCFFLPSGSEIVAYFYDRILKMWPIFNGHPTEMYLEKIGQHVFCAENFIISPGRLMIASYINKTVKLIDIDYMLNLMT